MEDQAYLIFELNHSRYGIRATEVLEIFFLPEVAPIAEAVPEMLGVLNLRGELLPVMDLQQRLGCHRSLCQLTDSMIVLQWQTQRVAMVVDRVDGIQTIAIDQITTGGMDGWPLGSLQGGMVAGIAQVEDTIVTLLNPEYLVRSAVQAVIPVVDRAASARRKCGDQDPLPSSWEQRQYGHLDSQARQTLRARANALRRSLENPDPSGRVPLAVVELGDEYFGLGLEIVHEFTDIDRITPVPCCPAHILGNINLRGEVVTLVDISQVIHLPIRSRRSGLKAVVVGLNQLITGIAVDEILDVIYLHPSQIMRPPVAMHSGKDDYLQGVARYQNKMMSIINLPKILTSEVLVVNEEVEYAVQL